MGGVITYLFGGDDTTTTTPKPTRPPELDGKLAVTFDLDEKLNGQVFDVEVNGQLISIQEKILDVLGKAAEKDGMGWTSLEMEPLLRSAWHLVKACISFPSELRAYLDIIQQHLPEKWAAEVDGRKRDHVRKLRQVRGDMPGEEVLSHLERNSVVVGAGGLETQLKWPRDALRRFSLGTLNHGSLESDLRKVAAVYSKVSAEQGQMKTFRPVQFAAIALYLQSAQQGRRVLGEMKTGEGKTDVVAAIASVLATWNKYEAVHIVTSSGDRATDDLKATAAFIKEFTGQPPLLAADAQGQSGQSSRPARVLYCQINDIMKLIVEAMQSSTLEKLLKHLRKCFCLVDEADFVWVEQSANQLYVSSSVNGYQALMPVTFSSLGLISLHKEYQASSIRTPTDADAKAGYLNEENLKRVRDVEGRPNENGLWPSMTPGKIHKEGKIASISQGGVNSLLKAEGEDFVITTRQEGGVEVPDVTIVCKETGEEVLASRWINEASFVEALRGHPAAGTQPIAYCVSVLTTLNVHGGLAGITGTIGEPTCLEYYGKHLSVSDIYRFPRNKPTMMYMLDPELATSTEDLHRNIANSALSYTKGKLTTSGKYGVPVCPDVSVAGPVLVVFSTVRQCEEFAKFFKDFDGSRDVEACPYFRGHHMFPESLANRPVIIASNKGGRGLDVKPAGDDVLLVILTQVLEDRQDMQARGRCGRNGKAGVVQYQLLLDKANMVHSGPAEADPMYRVVQLKLHRSTQSATSLTTRGPQIHKDMQSFEVLAEFSAWRGPYAKKLAAAVTKTMANVPPEELAELEGSLQDFLERQVIDQRWACWQDATLPRREDGHRLHHFRCQYALYDCEGLDAMVSSTDSGSLLNLASFLRFDSEEVAELGKHMLTIGKGMRSCAAFLLDLAIQPTRDWDAKFNWGTKFDGEMWQPEWTGSAALCLAALLSSNSPAHEVDKALLVYIECCETLRGYIREVPKLDFMAKQASHRFPRPIKHDGVGTWYWLQLELQCAQLEEAIKHAKGLKASRGPVKVQPLRQALQQSSVRGAGIDARMLRHMMGKDWTQAVFSWRPAGLEWCVPDRLRNDTEEWAKFLRSQAKRHEAEARDKAGEASGAGSGGVGSGDQRIEALAATRMNEETEGAVSVALHSSAPLGDFRGPGQAHAAQLRQHTWHRHVQDTASPSVVSEITGGLQRMSQQAVQVVGKVKRWSEAAENAFKWMAEQAKAAREWLVANAGNDAAREAQLVDQGTSDFANAVSKLARRAAPLLQKDLPPQADQTQDANLEGQVLRDGNKKDDRASSEIDAEIEQQAPANEFFAMDSEATEDEQYLQMRALAAMHKNLTGRPGSEQLLEQLDEVRRINAGLNQKAHEAYAAGSTLCSEEEAKAISAAYAEVLRAARGFMETARRNEIWSLARDYDDAVQTIETKNQEGARTKWWGWFWCPYSRWNYLEARKDFERFQTWGDTAGFNEQNTPGYRGLLLLNLARVRERGVHQDEWRRRHALCAWQQASWWERFWNPHLRVELGNTLRLEQLQRLTPDELQQWQRLQALQDRANAEFYKDHKSFMETVGDVCFVFSLIVAAVVLLLAIIAAAVVAIVIAIISLIACGVGRVCTVCQRQLEQRMDVTREEARWWQNLLSVIQAVTGFVEFFLAPWAGGAAEVAHALLAVLLWVTTRVQRLLNLPAIMETFNGVLNLFVNDGRQLHQGDGSRLGAWAAALQLFGNLAHAAQGILDLCQAARTAWKTLKDLFDQSDFDQQRSGEGQERKKKDKNHADAAQRGREWRRDRVELPDGEVHQLSTERLHCGPACELSEGQGLIYQQGKPGNMQAVHIIGDVVERADFAPSEDQQRKLLTRKGCKEGKDFVMREGSAHWIASTDNRTPHPPPGGGNGAAKPAEQSWAQLLECLHRAAAEKHSSSATKAQVAREMLSDLLDDARQTPSAKMTFESQKEAASLKVSKDDEQTESRTQSELAYDTDRVSLKFAKHGSREILTVRRSSAADSQDAAPASGALRVELDGDHVKVEGELDEESAQLLWSLMDIKLEPEHGGRTFENLMKAHAAAASSATNADTAASGERKSPARSLLDGLRKKIQDKRPELAHGSDASDPSPTAGLDYRAVVNLMANQGFKDHEFHIAQGDKGMHMLPAELKKLGKDFKVEDGDTNCMWRTILYLRERREGSSMEEAKRHAEDADEVEQLKSLMEGFIVESDLASDDELGVRGVSIGNPHLATDGHLDALEQELESLGQDGTGLNYLPELLKAIDSNVPEALSMGAFIVDGEGKGETVEMSAQAQATPIKTRAELFKFLDEHRGRIADVTIKGADGATVTRKLHLQGTNVVIVNSSDEGEKKLVNLRQEMEKWLKSNGNPATGTRMLEVLIIADKNNKPLEIRISASTMASLLKDKKDKDYKQATDKIHEILGNHEFGKCEVMWGNKELNGCTEERKGLHIHEGFGDIRKASPRKVTHEHVRQISRQNRKEGTLHNCENGIHAHNKNRGMGTLPDGAAKMVGGEHQPWKHNPGEYRDSCDDCQVKSYGIIQKVVKAAEPMKTAGAKAVKNGATAMKKSAVAMKTAGAKAMKKGATAMKKSTMAMKTAGKNLANAVKTAVKKTCHSP